MTDRVCVGVVIFFAANGAGVHGAAFLRAGGRDNCCLSAVGRVTERCDVGIAHRFTAARATVLCIPLFRACRGSYYIIPIMTERVGVGVACRAAAALAAVFRVTL